MKNSITTLIIVLAFSFTASAQTAQAEVKKECSTQASACTAKHAAADGKCTTDKVAVSGDKPKTTGKNCTTGASCCSGGKMPLKKA